jgi:hypothetical protein
VSPSRISSDSGPAGPLAALAPALFVALALVLTPLAGCGDDETGRVRPCGDGVCSASETPETCPLDCPSACAPGQTRCLGNVHLTCAEDGAHEVALPCQSGTHCVLSGCVATEGTGRD